MENGFHLMAVSDGCLVRLNTGSPSGSGGRAGERLVTCPHPCGKDRLAVGSLVVLEIAARQIEECRSGVTLIGKYESRGNR